MIAKAAKRCQKWRAAFGETQIGLESSLGISPCDAGADEKRTTHRKHTLKEADTASITVERSHRNSGLRVILSYGTRACNSVFPMQV